MSKNIETFKEQVRAEAAHQLEEIKSELRRRELVFSQVSERRALIIAELYSLMLQAMRAVEYHVKMQDRWPDEETREKELAGVHQKVRECRGYFDQNRIWLDEETCQKVQTVVEEDTEGLFYQFANAALLARSGLGRDWTPQKMLELWETANRRLPVARQALEAQFRKTLTTP